MLFSFYLNLRANIQHYFINALSIDIFLVILQTQNLIILNNMKKILTILLLGVTLSVTAQTARDEIRKNPFLAGSNYVDYNRQIPDFHYTKAPDGYVPFYFTHYGRHGSRWLIGKDDYNRVLRPLQKGRQYGKLTQEGERVLKELESFNITTYKRLGELTTVGERQHHGIGQRIAKNFPEIFLAKNVAIDARSTVVIRCILSMEAECEELMAANPTARIHNDVSEAFQYYLNQEWEGKVKESSNHVNRRLVSEFNDRNTHPDRLMKVLFNDPQWTADSIHQRTLMRQLFEMVINMQSHDGSPIDLINIFTEDERYELWRQNNVGWYLRYANSPMTDNNMPFSQFNLLTNIIETADTCVALGKPQATMRFGHEVCVMPLACLMELGNCNISVENLDDLDKYWQNYKIFPMGCNIQLIFYKPEKGEGDILVKAMLNEREVTLPVEATATPYYYKWSDLRQYWKEKLEKFKN